MQGDPQSLSTQKQSGAAGAAKPLFSKLFLVIKTWGSLRKFLFCRTRRTRDSDWR